MRLCNRAALVRSAVPQLNRRFEKHVIGKSLFLFEFVVAYCVTFSSALRTVVKEGWPRGVSASLDEGTWCVVHLFHMTLTRAGHKRARSEEDEQRAVKDVTPVAKPVRTRNSNLQVEF